MGKTITLTTVEQTKLLVILEEELVRLKDADLPSKITESIIAKLKG